MCGTDYALTKVYTFHLHSRWFFYQDKQKTAVFYRQSFAFLWKEEENYYNKSPPDFGVVRGRSPPGSRPEAYARGGVCFVYV